MGCELKFTTMTQVMGRDGTRVGPVRYLFNPATGGVMPIDDDIEDDEALSASEIASWERRLGLEIPRPDNTH